MKYVCFSRFALRWKPDTWNGVKSVEISVSLLHMWLNEKVWSKTFTRKTAAFSRFVFTTRYERWYGTERKDKPVIKLRARWLLTSANVVITSFVIMPLRQKWDAWQTLTRPARSKVSVIYPRGGGWWVSIARQIVASKSNFLPRWKHFSIVPR